MPEHKRVDPRALRSKKMLKDAVFSLLADHPEISQLTVQKIAKRAELNRATFYLHYEDLNDLLRQIVHEIFDDLSMKVEPLLQLKSESEQEQLVTFLSYFYEYRQAAGKQETSTPPRAWPRLISFLHPFWGLSCGGLRMVRSIAPSVSRIKLP